MRMAIIVGKQTAWDKTTFKHVNTGKWEATISFGSDASFGDATATSVNPYNAAICAIRKLKRLGVEHGKGGGA